MKVVRFVQQHKTPRQRLNAAATAVFILVAALVGAVQLASPAVASSTEVTVGMPFSGKWAADVNVNPDANGNYNDATSSHPSVHTPSIWGGDWATDLYAADGTDVKLNVSVSSGTLSYEYVSTTNGTCGHRLVFKVKVDGAEVGRLYFDHLKNEVTSTNGISNGGVLGKVDEACHVGYAHTHVEFKNSTAYACWTDHGHPGASLTYGASIGILGSANTGARQSCVTSGGGSSGSGHADTIGIYNPTTAVFDLRNSNTPGIADIPVQYGNSNMVPLVGDWDGNGTVTVGIYNPATAVFDLRNTNTPGNADNSIQYGNVGAIPVVGDWDGDGDTTIGVYYPSSAVFDLRNDNSPGNADIPSIQYGNSNMVPIVGDWDGNGTTTIGIYNPTTAVFDLRNSNTPGIADIPIQYGNIGAKPIVGDWDGDGDTTIGVYYPTPAVFDLRNDNSPGNADIPSIQYGNSNMVPIVGDWDNA